MNYSSKFGYWLSQMDLLQRIIQFYESSKTKKNQRTTFCVELYVTTLNDDKISRQRTSVLCG